MAQEDEEGEEGIFFVSKYAVFLVKLFLKITGQKSNYCAG